jgi:phage tail protein X
MAALTLIARQGDTLDALLWRDAGIGPAGVGPTLAANPGVAELGTIIPAGTAITVPNTPAEQSQTRKLVQLWD